MIILGQFRWWRRLRGGYWAQVTSPLFGVKRWVRCIDHPAPIANTVWTFYPWAKKEMGNGYIDEWYADTGYSAIPLSMALNKIVGTADPDEIRRMLDEARDTWRPPTVTREPTAKELAARLSCPEIRRFPGKPGWKGREQNQ